jgi:ABC-type transport system involved in cytochrome c biogenesis permease subunit
MKKFFASLTLVIPLLSWSQTNQMQNISPEEALQQVTTFASKIETEPIRRAALVQNGRVKPFDTFARETVLFLTGSYRRWGNNPVQTYLAFASVPSSPYAPVIEVRSPDLRVELGYTKEKRFFSLADLESSRILNLAEPVFKKQEEGGKLNESEKKIAETYSQMSVFQQIFMGEHFVKSIDFSFLNGAHQDGASPVSGAAKSYIDTMKQGKIAEATALADNLVQMSRSQDVPDLFRHYMKSLDTEILFNELNPFFWAYIFCFVTGFIFLFEGTRKKLSAKLSYIVYLLPLVPLIAGIAFRVYITRFAPVTNMYGTMIWVSFGVIIFSLLLFALYKNGLVSGSMLIGSGLILLLTNQIPLVLSPDMDPIVAVLRSNFWLSTHVTTITISYAAFTMAMILGNIALVRIWTHKNNENFFREYSHYAYRMIQLGCFLLTVGIILGGVWADYSWGRFWGWDPKETWALIADLGFLVLLHARYIGWVNEFTLLAFAPVSYLLVVMAWYGVNFILAAGLHSYGFSSGGATAVAVFVSVQLILLLAALYKYYSSAYPKTPMTK